MLSPGEAPLLADAAVDVESGFDFLSREYRELFDAAGGSAFQAPILQSMLHTRLATRLKATQHTVVVRERDNGKLLAVFPLVLQRSRGITLLVPADFGVCDYNEPVAAPLTLEALARSETVLRNLADATAVGDLMLYRKVRADAFDVGRLFLCAKATPAENSAYHSDLEEDFDLWRRRVLRKRFSKELGRLGRQLESESGAFDTRLATTADEISEAFNALRSFRDGKFADDLLLKPAYFEFYRDYAIAAAASGEALTYVSRLAGRIVAVLFGVHGDGNFHAVQIGNHAGPLAKYSLGMQILFRTIRMRHDMGHRYFDLGLGNTGYKDHFRVEETGIRNFSRPRTLRGTAVQFVYARAKPVKNALRAVTQVR